jgi:hypothetical protein
MMLRNYRSALNDKINYLHARSKIKRKQGILLIREITNICMHILLLAKLRQKGLQV